LVPPEDDDFVRLIVVEVLDWNWNDEHDLVVVDAANNGLHLAPVDRPNVAMINFN
jgi:hypothetical protein